jgi:hypothetical protein
METPIERPSEKMPVIIENTKKAKALSEELSLMFASLRLLESCGVSVG